MTIFQHPYLGEHFAKLMPPLLLFIDDYEVKWLLLLVVIINNVLSGSRAVFAGPILISLYFSSY